MSNKNPITMEKLKEERIRDSDVYMTCTDQKKSCIKYNSFSLEKWSHLGLNQGPSDYESDALTN